MLTSLHPVTTDQESMLSPETLELAKRYLGGEFKDTIANATFGLSREEAAALSPHMQYARIIQLIAEKVPLRIIESEKLVGAATLLEAVKHGTPAIDFAGTSHVTVGFNSVLKTGYKGLRQKLEDRLTDSSLTDEQKEFLQSMVICLDAARCWHNRHVNELRNRIQSSPGSIKQHYLKVYDNMRMVPENPPETFREAVQSLWLMFSFQRLCGNWSGLGRMDQMLGSYLENDLQNGTITLDEARELLAHFWIKGTEWRGATEQRTGGDAQFYQNVILGGIDKEGKEVTNAVTYLILDIVKELHISDYPVAVRVNPNTPEKLLRRIAEVQRDGGGIVSVYNEELVINSLINFGFPEEDAREFTNDGCWEAIIGGKSAFTYLPFDSLQLLQKSLTPEADFSTYEKLYKDFLAHLTIECRKNDERASNTFIKNKRYIEHQISPTPLLSLFVEGCIESVKDYNNRGAKYTIAAIHAGGLPDVANSLYVLKKLVFEEQQLSLNEFINILDNDWEGNEALRMQIMRDYQLYGNDNNEADQILSQLVADYAEIAGKTHDIDGLLRPVGISTFGREIAYAPDRKATAFGRKAGEILATNLAPTPGTDRLGPTAVIKSFCQCDFSATPNGCPLDLKLHPSCCRGEAGINIMVGLFRTFMDLGGFYLQIDVVDSDMLRDAQKHPGKYPNLCVRISGWSARFDTLDRTWQDMIIERTQQIL